VRFKQESREKGGIARIDDVELFCLEWSLERALILSMASLRGGGGVEF